MIEWLTPYLARLAEEPVLQGLVAALATFVLEDPTTVGCGLLVAEEKMAFMTALTGVWLGIAIGDVGLYGIGRFGGTQLEGRGYLRSERVRHASLWLEKNLVLAVVVSRFVPGMRLPTYLAAGLLRAPLVRFTVVAVLASLIWTLLLLWATVLAGQRIMPLLGGLRWPSAALALLALVLLQRRISRAVEKRLEDGEARRERPVSFFEFWPPVVFYAPVAVHWCWLALRFRGLLLPSIANPSIYSGGLIGESKKQILDLVGSSQRRWVARYLTIEIAGGREESISAVKEKMKLAELDYPVVAKPDVGQRGAGVWPLFGDQDLGDYLDGFPPGHALMVQELVGFDGRVDPASSSTDFKEAGVMYWRLPGEESGSIPSITVKRFPEVVGDGERTIAKLIDDDPRARHLARVYRERLRAQLELVPAEGERVPLVFAGNHCQGVINKNGNDFLTPELQDRIDAIARSMPGFYFGRFDIRFNDFDEFLGGEGFKIVEVNGASGEATHIWDASTTLGEAYGTLREQFHALFTIGVENRRRGHKPMRLVTFLGAFFKYHRVARIYPKAR